MTSRTGEVRKRLSPNLRAGLDVARALATLYVVAHHVANSRGWSHGPGLILRFGQEAVLVFFLLSGFVIFANERCRALTPSGYYWRRIRRIYPALLFSMLVSAAVAFDNGDFGTRFNWSELFTTLASLQDISLLKPGVIADPFLGNDPLWSISYEVAFYLVFPFVLKAWTRNPHRVEMSVGAVCCASYITFVYWPNHFSLVATYFLVWWCGAMAADAYQRGGSNFWAFLPSLSWLALLCVIAGIAVTVTGFRGVGYYPFLPFRHFAVALVFLVVFSNCLGATIAKWCAVFAAPGAAIASISYGLYVLHHPLLVDSVRAQKPNGFLIALVILLGFAYAVDRRFNAYLGRRATLTVS
jgi:peptidoglycan/LPS O-acetylase OafA/YrhL